MPRVRARAIFALMAIMAVGSMNRPEGGFEIARIVGWLAPTAQCGER
jgi:hypothetical protein